MKGDFFLIILNGNELHNVSGKSLADLVAQQPTPTQNIVVELNGTIIHHDQLETTRLKENDHVELISFVGGG